MMNTQFLTDITRASTAMFSWWIAELAAALPVALRKADNNAFLTVQFGEDGMLELAKSDSDWRYHGWQSIRDLPFPAQAHAIADALQGSQLAHLPIVLQLAPGQVMRKRIQLPLAAEENLRDTLSYQMEKNTSFSADEVLFGCKVLRRDVDMQRLDIDFAVVPKSLVDDIMAQARRVGLHPCAINCVGVNGQADLAIEQAHVATASRVAGFPRATRILAALVAVLLIADIVVPLWRDRIYLEDLRTELGEVKAAAAAATALRAEINAERDQASFAARRRERMPTMTELLTELTRLVPDDTWVSHVQVENESIQIVGYSAAANNLIPVLEQSKYFSNATFRSPVTQDLSRGLEQFQLSIGLRRRLE